LGGGAWVGEYQRKVRKLTAGSNGREGDRRRELRGSRGGGGGHGGGGGRSRRKGGRAELGYRAQEVRREVGDISELKGRL